MGSNGSMRVAAVALILVGCSSASGADPTSSRAAGASAASTADQTPPATGASPPVSGTPAPSVRSGSGVVLTYAEVFSGGLSTPKPDTLVATLVGDYGKMVRDGVFESLVNAQGFYICEPPGTRTCNLFPTGPGAQDQTRQTLQYRRPLDFLTEQVVAGTTKHSTRTVAGRAGRCLSGRDQITGETDSACADVATGCLIYLNMPDLLGSLSLVSIRTGLDVGPLVLPAGYSVASS